MCRLMRTSNLRVPTANPRTSRDWATGREWILARLIVVALFCLCFPDRDAAAERQVDLQLVLAVDISRSMDLEEAGLQRQGFVRAFRHQDVIDAIQRGPLGRIALTYVEWGSDRYQITRVDWAEVSDAGSADEFAAAIERSSAILVEWTSISGAIDYGARSFEGNGFQSERRIIDVSGDGPNNSGGNVALARDNAVADGIVINGLPIINDRPNINGYPRLPDLDLYYEDCVRGGAGSFIVVAHGFEDFAQAILRKLVTEIAGRTPPPRLFQLAAARARVPCNAGERQLKEWLRYQNFTTPPLYDF